LSALSLPNLQLNHLLGVIAAALAALVIWPWLQSPSSAQAPGATADAVSSSPALPTLPPVARFAAIAERPLFSPSRRPAPGEKAAPAGPGIEQRYHLLGLINTGDTRRALLSEGKRRFAIAEGAALEGWTVTRIEHDSVVLSSPAGQAMLLLQPAAGEAWVDPSPMARPPLPEKPATEKPGAQ
jgi:hypothetical protein